MKTIKCHICGKENTGTDKICFNCNQQIIFTSPAEEEYSRYRGGRFLNKLSPKWHAVSVIFFPCNDWYVISVPAFMESINFMRNMNNILGHVILPVIVLIKSLLFRFEVGSKLEPEKKWLNIFGLTGASSLYIVDLTEKILGHSILPVTTLVTSLLYDFKPYRSYERETLLRDVALKIYKTPSSVTEKGERKVFYEKYIEFIPKYCKKKGSELLSRLTRLDLPELPAGLYTVEISDSFNKLSYSFCLSDIEIIALSSKKSFVSMACNKYTGEILNDADFYFIHDKEKQLIPSKDGIIKIIREELKDSSGAVEILASRGDSEAEISIPPYYRAEEKVFKGYVYTDRPVYRPGQRVNFKGILRKGKDLNYRDGEDIKVNIKDSKDKEIYHETLRTDEYGTISDHLTLPELCPSGKYYINIKDTDNYTNSIYFNVSEYRKPEFYVTIDSDRPFYIPGDTVTITVEGFYYFGKPLAHGTVDYTVRNDEYPIAEYYGKIKTDENGKCTFSWNVNDKQIDRRYNYKIKITLSDEYGREIEAYKSICIYPFPCRLILSSDKVLYGPGEKGYYGDGYTYKPVILDKYYVRKGETVPFKIKALDYSGEPVKIDIILRIIDELSEEAERMAISTDKEGYALWEYTFNKTGTYTLEYSLAKNCNIKTRETIYCYSAEDYLSKILIIADKQNPGTGEILNILVLFPPSCSGNAIVTVEGHDILYYFIDLSEKKLMEFSLDIDENYRDGFYICVYYSDSGGVKFIGKKVVTVRRDKLLTLSVDSDKEEYVPREYAKFIIKTSDCKDKPVTSQVTMGVVDASIYGINEDKREDIQRFFLKSRIKLDNISHHIDGAPGLISSTGFEHKDYYRKVIELIMNFAGWTSDLPCRRVNEALCMTKCEEEVVSKSPDFTRENFYDAIYFNPNIITDHNGIAEVAVPLPDNLTTWRATLTGVTKDTMVGDTIKNITVARKLFARIIAPRFFRERDETAIIGVIHNYLSSEKTVSGKLITEGAIKLLNKSDYEVNISPGNTATVIWNIKVHSEGSCSLKLSALTDEESDEIKITLPVLPHGCEKTVSVSGSTDGYREETLIMPEEGNISSGRCIIIMEPSIASSVLSSIEYLVGFPYGCVEQTMNRFLPNVIVAKAFEELDLLEELKTDTVIPADEEEITDTEIKEKIEEQDGIIVQVARNLIDLMKDYDKGILLNRLKSVRRRMALEHGILYPFLTLTDNVKLSSNSYAILIKGKEVATGEVMLRKLLAAGPEEQIEKLKGKKAIIPTYNLPALWINEQRRDEAILAGCNIFDAVDVIEAHFAEVIKSHSSLFHRYEKNVNVLKTVENKYEGILKDLPDMVRVGLERLYLYRHSDGGWGWWQHDNSLTSMTAYVVYGLSLADRAGYKLNRYLIDCAIRWMKEHYEKEYNLNLKAFMVFASIMSDNIPGVSEREFKSVIDNPVSFPIIQLRELFDKREELDNYGKAVLALALAYKKNDLLKEAREVAELIERSAEINETEAWWNVKDIGYGWTHSMIETTAYCLKALLEIKKESSLIEKVIKFLSRKRKGNKWNSTKDTAAVLMTMTDYLKNSGEINSNFMAEVYLNGKEFKPVRFNRTNLGKEGKKLVITCQEGLKHGENKIRFNRKGHGRLYYSIHLSYYTKEEHIKASSSGFEITRNYFICNGDDSALISTLEYPFFNVNLYDIIMVQLKIKGKPEYEYVIIEDQKPAGCEFLEKKGYFCRWGGDNRYNGTEWEVKDDRVAFFFSGWNRDACEINYYMKVETMGTFHVMPARAGLMYNPEINGISDELVIKTPFSYTGKVKDLFKRIL